MPIFCNIAWAFLSGWGKPWNQNVTLLRESLTKPWDKKTEIEYWFHILIMLGNRHGLQIDVEFFAYKVEQPPVGRYPTTAKMIEHIRTKASNNWSAYEIPTSE